VRKQAGKKYLKNSLHFLQVWLKIPSDVDQLPLGRIKIPHGQVKTWF
jgi:hypothetical protein